MFVVPVVAVLVLLAASPALAQAARRAAAWTASDCQTCHEKATGAAFTRSKHAGLDQSCGNCHDNVGDHFRAQSNGDANGPVPSLKKLTANQINTTCLKCHEKAGQANYLTSLHARRNVACTQCHGIHEYKSIRAQLKTQLDPETCAACHKPERSKSMRTSHHPVREGKMSCASCHNPHDGARPKMLKADSVNELCYKCHAEKRGPFLFEHAPVREDCAVLPRAARNEPQAAPRAEAAEPVLELPSHRLRPLRIGRQPLDRAGRAHRPARCAERLPDGELAVRREELQELPRECARLQLALGRVLCEVTHEESIERHSAPRHGLPHGDSSRDGAVRAGRLQHPHHQLRRHRHRHQRRPADRRLAGRDRRRLVEVHEYRDVPEGVSVPCFNLFSTSKGLDFNLFGYNVRQTDQRYNGWFNTSAFDLSFDYNQTPHNMGNGAHTIQAELSQGVWGMSDTLQQSLGTTVNATPTAGRTVTFYDTLLAPTFASAGSVDVSSLRKRGTATLDLGKKLPFDLTFTYMRELKSGYRGEEGGGVYSAVSSVVEMPGPLNETTQDFGVQAAWNFAKGNIHGWFSRNLYDNDAETLTVDNPFQWYDQPYVSTPAPAVGGGTSARWINAPDNEASTSNLGFLLKFGRQTRIGGRPHAGELDAERAVLPVHDQHGDPDADRGQRLQPVGAPAAVVRRQDRHDDDQPDVLVEAGGEPRHSRAVPQLRPEQQDGPFRHHR